MSDLTTSAVMTPGTMCPLCHRVDHTVTETALATGGGWRCATCGQRWDAARLETVAVYELYVASRAATVTP